tara:strand:+ start:1041 stop:1148 length:108 start_codon:yes stop_codon:yes gene_type:complete
MISYFKRLWKAFFSKKKPAVKEKKPAVKRGRPKKK